MMYIAVLSVLFIFLGISTIRTMYTKNNKEYTTSKVITCSLYLIIGVATYLTVRNPLYFKFIPMFIGFFLGDIFLALCHTDDGLIKSKQFLLGLGCFGLGHIFFIIQLGNMLDWNVKFYWFIGGVVYAVLILINRNNPNYKFGKKAVACAAYGFIIGSIANLGIIVGIAHWGELAYMLIAFSTICFIVSDTIIAHKYFAIKKRKWYGAAELGLYYTAMLIVSTFIAFL